ncbi:hypothetical protein [Rhodococcus spelaei]|nr:hypothetical protein [Rhodococcus spelaei]
MSSELTSLLTAIAALLGPAEPKATTDGFTGSSTGNVGSTFP